MLSKGIATDIASGRPAVEVADEKKEAREKQDEQVLKDRAAYAVMLASEPGRLVVGIIRDRLNRRIQILAEADPEAKTLIGLLSEFGIKDGLAEDAVQKLFDRHMRKGASSEQ